MKQMRNDDLTKISIIVMPICWLITLVVVLVLYFGADKKVWALSYLLGMVTALMTLGLTMSTGRGFINEVNKADGAPVRRTVLGYLLRIIIAGLVFAFIVREQVTSDSPRFIIIPALIGYITEKVVFIIVSLIINLNKKRKVNS